MTEPGRDPGWLRRWWPLYATLAVLAFAVPETVAIVAPGEGGTLTEATQDWLGTGGGQVTAGWVAMTVLVAGFAVWWPGHLLGWWPWERRGG